MWGRRRWSTVLATLVTVVGLAGCGGGSGGDSGSVKSGVLSGVDGVASADRLTTTIRLDTTPAALQALGQASGNTVDSGLASALAGANIVIERVKRSGGSDLDIRAVAAGKTLVELRSVGQTLYLQGDVRDILALAGKPKVYANLRGQTKSMPSFVQAAITGQWVSLPAATLNSLATLTGGAPSSAPSNGPKLLADLRHTIDKDVTVTKAGTDARGTHYVMHADTKKLATDLRASISDAVPGGSALGQRVPANTKHQTFSFDAWVKDGSLSELSINLLQFGDTSKVPSGTTLPLTITFDKTGADITAPSGVTPVDVSQLGTLFGALTGSG